ncbi:MAG: hypothetical protein AB9873_01825 [Syntrophobacteraceae bacterium]
MEDKERNLMVDRCDKANEAYCEECEKQGVKVCSMEELQARQEFMDGLIDEGQLQARAATEMSEYAKTFGKYLVVQDQQPGAGDEDAEKRDRARLANKVYKQVCNEEGLELCFFSDFSSWSEYVKGDIEDSELYGRAKAEVEKLASA